MGTKNGIIIDQVMYKVVRRTYYGFGNETDPCQLCDIRKHCERDDAQPCRIYNRQHKLAHFKKVNDNS